MYDNVDGYAKLVTALGKDMSKLDNELNDTINERDDLRQAIIDYLEAGFTEILEQALNRTEKEL